MPVVRDLPVLHEIDVDRAEPNLATIAFQVFEPAGEMSREDVSNNSAVLHNQYVCCAIDSLLLPFHTKKLRCATGKGSIAITSSSIDGARQLLRSALLLPSAWRRRPRGWRLRLRPYGSWLARHTTAPSRD